MRANNVAIMSLGIFILFVTGCGSKIDNSRYDSESEITHGQSGSYDFKGNTGEHEASSSHLNINESVITEQLDKYVITSEWSPYANDIERGETYLTIEDDGNFWVRAQSLDTEEYVLLNINTKDEIIDRFAGNASFIINSELFCNDNGDTAQLFDRDANDITDSWNPEYGKLYAVGKDKTGWTFWYVSIEDTYERHDEIITAISEDGSVKAQWDLRDFFEDGWSFEFSKKRLKYLGGAVYSFRSSNLNVIGLNVENGASYIFKNDTGEYSASVDDNVVLFGSRNDGWGAFAWYDLSGEALSIPMDSYRMFRCLGEGMVMLMDSSPQNVNVFDFDMNLKFNKEGIKDLTDFYNGYSMVTVENNNGVEFTSLIDRDGSFAFEPIRGSAGDYACYCEHMWKYKYRLCVYENSERQYLFCDENGEGFKTSIDCHIFVKSNDGIEYGIIIDKESGRLKHVSLEDL